MSFVTTGDAGIFYKCEGPEAAPTLVLSSSLGTHHGMWDEQMPDFARSYRVLRYDTRGHGASDVPQKPVDIATLGRDVLGLLDALGVRRAHFCGLSLGGMIGQWLGATAAERLERLILCSTSAYLGNRDTWNARIEAVRKGGMAAVADMIVERWFTPAFRQTSPAAPKRIRDMLLACPAEGYAACCAAVRDMDQRELLAGIRVPTLVLSGRHDPGTPPEHARFIAERIAGAQLVELDASHLCNIEASAAFGAAVHEFLEEA
jgi:3-oxoadipate enol-lactonase